VADFSKRPDEMLKELEAIKSVLPDQALKRFEDAIAKYRAWRREALEDLLKVLEENEDDESARSWIDLCSTMRADAPEFFEEALTNILLGQEQHRARTRLDEQIPAVTRRRMGVGVPDRRAAG
jgi:flagellar motor component MotA